MRKLAWFGFGFALAVFLSHYLLPLPALYWCALGAVFLASGGFLLKGLNRRRWMLCLVAAAIGFGWYAFRAHRVLDPLDSLDGKTEQVYAARVLDYPVHMDYSTSVMLHLDTPGLDRLAVRAYAHDERCDQLQPGDLVTVTMKLRSAAMRYGEETDAYLSMGIAAIGTVTDAPVKTGEWKWKLLCLPKVLSHKVQTAAAEIFPEDTFPFAEALMLGDKRALYDAELDVPLRNAGIMHAVAVSGMHLAFLIGAVELLFGKRRFLSLLSLPLLGFFALMAGATPSVLRAGLMAALVLLAPALERENDPATSLMAALLLILLCQPFSAGSASLQLSFAAMAGVLWLTGPIYHWVHEHLFGGREIGDAAHGAITAVAASLGSMVPTMPLGALHFGTLTLAAPLTNLLVFWVLPIAFVGSFLAVLLGMLSLPLGTWAAWLVSWPLRFVLLVARGTASLPGLRYDGAAPLTIFWLAVCYLVGLALWLRHRKGKPVRLLIPICGCLALLLVTSLAARMIGEATPRVTVLDIGQGQSVFFRSGKTSLLVDCGGINSPVNAGDTASRALLRERRESLDVLVLTHPHQDHVNGVQRLLQETRVRTLILPAAADAKAEPLRSILETAAERGTEIIRLEDDAEMTLGDLGLQFFVALGREVEDGCLMLRVTRGDFDTMITGDVPIETETVLAAEYDLSGTELFIAGHHGSKHASGDALLDALGAGTAVISCGYNTYGHPTQETLDRLAAHGMEIRRTDTDGSVTITLSSSQR